MPLLKPSRLQAGFTLVELLIVVIILAILAAIVIPQFSSATVDTQESALDANLAGMRNAIELYKVQHNVWPGAAITGTAAACTGTAGVGVAGTSQALIDQLILFSDKNGNTCSTQSVDYRYGPYVRKALPVDPRKDINTVAVTTAGTPIVVGADTGGWAFDTVSGQLVINSNALDTKGAAYSLR